MKLLMNLSMVGVRPTGLGVYSVACSRIVEKIRSVVISSRPLVSAEERISSPISIGIGGGKLAAIKRNIWLRRLRFDDEFLVYSPTHHGVPGHSNQIITIHDLISLRFPRQHFLQYAYFKWFVPRLLRQCRAVFTVSETSKADIVQAYGFPEGKIYVVPNSIDPARFSPLGTPPEPFLLMVGARFSHKNVSEVLLNHSAWSFRYRLIVTSCSGPYREELESLIASLDLTACVEFLDYVDPDELLSMYRRCSALIYPSRWEGFGIPPLEVLACGRPVIASDIPVHREVLGDAAIYVELGNTDSWILAIESLSRADLVRGKVELGDERVRYYSAERSLAMLESSLKAVEPRLELL
ncbi:TPA: glycosyltransferase family 4 protein [Stenotrophomonas maltophilia]|nr:glycosyltransferase family 4 protein [Stenotrophomonas maltophilia]